MLGRVIECEAGSLEWRQKITATKAVAILAPEMGFRAFQTPLEVWCDIMAALRGEESEDQDNAFMRWGRWTERNNRELISRELDRYVSDSPGMVVDAEFDWLATTPDGVISEAPGDEGSGIWEGKSPSVYKRDDWMDCIPASVLAQLQLNMRTTGFRWGVGSAFLPPSKADDVILVHHKIARNEGFIENAVDYLRDWWERYVLADRMPEPTGDERDKKLLSGLHPRHAQGKSISFSDGLAAQLPKLAEYKAAEKENKAKASKIENLIRAELGDSERGEGGGYAFTWKTSEVNIPAREASKRKQRTLRKAKVAK